MTNSKINALIAEHIMEWVLTDCEERWIFDLKAMDTIDLEDWRPATDMNDAMDVLKQLDKYGFGVQMVSQGDNVWRVFISKDYSTKDRFSDESLPKAICLAALKAIGVDIDAEV